MTFPSFEAAKAGYGKMYRSMTIRPERRAALEHTARTILRGKSRYLVVERTTGVPWFCIGLIHDREADCNFACHLHNGDNGAPDAMGRLTRRTTHVTAGRPLSAPPWTWEQSAKDALAVDGLDRITDWSIERILYMNEKFNGGGYVGHNVNSPYIWGGSNHYGDRSDPEQHGKYTSDGVYNPNFIDTQLGCAPMLAVMMEMDPSIAVWLGSPLKTTVPAPEPKPTPVPVEPSVAKKVAKHTATTTVATGAAAAAHWWGFHPGATVAVFVAAFIIFAIIMSKLK